MRNNLAYTPFSSSRLLSSWIARMLFILRCGWKLESPAACTCRNEAAKKFPELPRVHETRSQLMNFAPPQNRNSFSTSTMFEVATHHR